MKKILSIMKKITQVQLVMILSVVLIITGGIMSLADSTNLTINESYDETAGTNSYDFSDGSYYKTISAGESLTIKGVNINSSDTAYAQFDLVVVPSSDNDNLDGVSVLGANDKDSSINDAYVSRDNELSFDGSTSVTITNDNSTNLEVYVFRAYTKDGYHHNEYVTSFFELQMLQDEKMHNSNSANTALEGSGTSPADYAEIESYRNIYVLKNLTAGEELTLNIPCYINILNSNIKLNEPLTIKHGYGGLFAIETITGQIDNSEQVFTIDTPQAYYIAETGNPLVSYDETKFVKKVLNDGKDYSDEILSDAREYVKNYIPKYIFGDIVLPTQYNNFGVTYSYEVSDTDSGYFSQTGNVNRKATNSHVTITCTTHYNGTDYIDVFDRTVAGTSDDALTTVLLSQLSDYMDRSCDIIDGKKYLTRSVDVKLILDQFMRDSKTVRNINLDFNKVGLYFEVNGEVGGVKNVNIEKSLQSLKLIYSAIDSEYKVTLSDNSLLSYASVDSIILRFSNYTAGDTSGDFEFSVCESVGSSSAESATYTLKGMDIEERNNLLERYRGSIYYTSVGDKRDILNLQSDGIYNGSEQCINSDLGLTTLSYKIYCVDLVSLNSPVSISTLMNGNEEYNSYKLLGTVAEGAYFTIDDIGELVLNKAISIDSNKALVLVSTVKYSDDATGGKEYYSWQQIIIPASGIGGDEYSVFRSGHTFSDRFEKKTYLSFIDPFESGNANVTLDIEILTVDGKAYSESEYGFVKIRKVDSDTSYIDIDIDSVPSANTSVVVQAVFRDSTQPITSDPISTQTYPFTIPEIYRLGTDVEDVWMYLRMLETYDTNTYKDYPGYLFANDVQSEPNDGSETFDCSDEKLDAIYNGTSTSGKTLQYFVDNNIISQDKATEYYNSYSENHSIKGAQLLTATKKMFFDDIKPTSIDVFVSNHIVTELSMKNCGLSDITPLINFDNLNKITLSVNNDNIKDFRPLCDLSTLKTVYLANNVCDSGYYGTNGEINLSTYVALMDSGVDIYSTDTNKIVFLADGETLSSSVRNAGGYEISNNEKYLAVCINSILNMNSFYTSDLADSDIVGISVPKNNSSDTTPFVTKSVEGETVSGSYYVISIMDGTDTVYRSVTLNK